MPDTYGTEPHEHETDLNDGLTDHDIVREVPSQDEFHDDYETHAATVDTETPEDQDGGLPSEENTQQRRAPVVPIAAAAGVLLLLGAVAWWQFGGTSSPQTLQLSDTPPHPLTMSSLPTTAALPTAPTGAPASDNPLTQLADNNAPTAPRTSSETAVPLAAAPVAAVAAPVPSVTPAPVPVAAMPPAPAAAPVKPVMANGDNLLAMTAPTPAVTTSTALPVGEDGRIAALTARIDNLQKALDQANQQLGQVTNMVAATATTAPQATANKDMQDRLDKMEQQLAELNHTAPILAAPTPVATASDIVAVPAAVKAVKKAPAHHHTSAPKPVIVAHKAKATHTKTAKAEPKSAKTASKWVLRAAMPGQAWVSDSATSHDLKQVQVGDTLPGIGKVMAIQTIGGGSWVVRGAHGSIE